MKFIIQRVSHADVAIKSENGLYGEPVGQIGAGFLVLVGVGSNDTEAVAAKMVKKMLGLRIFADAEGKSNLDIKSVGGELLIISQFTLYADCKKGHRPSFIEAANADLANQLYQFVIAACKKEIEIVEAGVFGASMRISMVGEGPFTVVLDSEELFRF